jgi:hypothetical protein
LLGSLLAEELWFCLLVAGSYLFTGVSANITLARLGGWTDFYGSSWAL